VICDFPYSYFYVCQRVNDDSPRFPLVSTPFPDLKGVAHALELVAREAEAQIRGNPAWQDGFL
jgi:hypothetical protein